ncbi:hypothetical protein [Mycolicibacterium mageritense]|uniref:hypothetical protein n=1 Tax=Mycolicibacterium mageritense TaxID=53462 RepID=UPI001E4094F1|nr:hypothetical protein [Mycolicibacterium mageritense]MCC9186058.1 hypothetical protein [Mycolicibacterium mageritense]
MTTYDYRDDFEEPTDAEIDSIVHLFDGDRARARDYAERFPAALGKKPRPGTPSEKQGNEFCAEMLRGDDLVAARYERITPGFWAAYHAISVLPELARIAETAVAADRQMIDGDDGGPFVILTTRPGERFVLDDANVLEAAISMADQYGAVCDLQCSYGGSGYCIEDMKFSQRHKLDGSAYMDKYGRFINRPFTFPFAYGEYVVLSKICITCWNDLVKRNKIKDVRIQNPWETVG